MKKMLALLLAVCMLSFSFGAFAEGLNLDDVAAEGLGLDLAAETEKNLTNKAAASTDKVEDVNGKLVVTTNFGLVFTYTPVAGAYALTQSYFHDISLYNAVYNDPAAVIQSFVEKGMHLNVFVCDENSSVDVYFYADEAVSNLGQVIGNANNLSDSDAETVAQYLAKACGYEFTYGLIGDQVWFVANLISNHNALHCYTFVGGHIVEVVVRKVVSNNDVDVAMTLMEAVSITSK